MQEEIYSSSYAAAAYLESVKFPKDKKASCPLQTSCPRFAVDMHGILSIECGADSLKEALRRALQREKRRLAQRPPKRKTLGRVQALEGFPGLQVYVVGDVGIQEELDLKGINHIGGPADKDQVVELKPGYALPHDHDVS